MSFLSLPSTDFRKIPLSSFSTTPKISMTIAKKLLLHAPPKKKEDGISLKARAKLRVLMSNIIKLFVLVID